MKTPKVPSYGLHKPTGQARCYVNGKTAYLGKFGSEESRIRYGEVVAKVVSGQTIDPMARKNVGSATYAEVDPGPTINEICLVFLRHAETHYVKAGKQTSEVSILKFTMRPLTEMYGMTPASEFGPLCLKAVRTRMVELGWTRSTINTSIGRIRRIFKHAIENELIDSSILDRLKCVAPLLAGRTEAHDNAPRTPVDLRSIATVRRLVSPLVRDLIGLQRLPSITKKGDRRYRYYVCSSAQKLGWDTCPSKSVPAGEMERFVVGQIRMLGTDPEFVQDVLQQIDSVATDELDGLRERERIAEADVRHWDTEIQRVAAAPGSADKGTCQSRSS